MRHMRGKLALALILVAVGVCAFIFYMKRTVIVPGAVEIAFKGTSTETVRIFYDRGKGYSETQVITTTLTGLEDETAVLKLPSFSISGIRIFVGGQGSVLGISSICYKDLASQECWSAPEIASDFAPVRDISDFSVSNGVLHMKSSGLIPHFEYKGDFRRLQTRLRKEFMMIAIGALTFLLLPMFLIHFESSSEDGSALGALEPVWTTIKIVVVVVAVVAVIASACEGLIQFGLRNKNFYAKLPTSGKRIIREVYLKHVQPQPQFMPKCAAYDRELFYTLLPGGACTIGTREFSSEIRVNSMGVRDSEGALKAPEAVVIGDSTAMGYGVAAGAAFPARLGKLLGKRTLDAAVPSYGTARQSMMLGRVDLADARVLVIQYSPDDFDENSWYMKNGGTMPGRGADQYAGFVTSSSVSRDYFFGKYLIETLKKAEKLFRKPDEPVAAIAAAKLFMQVLGTMDLSMFERVVVVEVGQGPQDAGFVTALSAEIRNAWPALEGKVTPLDVSKYLGEEHFFPLDGHLNESGHEVVAKVIASALQPAQ